MVKSVLTVPLMPRLPIQTGSGPHFDHDRDDVVDPPKRMERKGKIWSLNHLGATIYYMFMVLGIWEARDCCHFLHSTVKKTLCVWGGGGVGGDNNVICTSTHMWCNISVRSLAFHALPHMCHATLLSILLHFHTYVMLRCRYSCTSTHVSCYAAVDSLALPHMCHATL